MDLLETLVPVSEQDEQACEIFNLLNNAKNKCKCKGKNNIFYRPPVGVIMFPDVKNLLIEKGYQVIEQPKYDLTWTDIGPVRGTRHLVYYIGILR